MNIEERDRFARRSLIAMAIGVVILGVYTATVLYRLNQAGLM